MTAEDLISGLSFQMSLADKGYDAHSFREAITVAGGMAVIPSRACRKGPIPYDKDIYKERNLAERFFNNVKHFRRIVPRCDKTVLSFASFTYLAGAMIWLR
jgi:transposase